MNATRKISAKSKVVEDRLWRGRCAEGMDRTMRKVKIITAAEAANLVKDNDTLTTMGFVGCSHPEALTKALEKRFLETGSPKNLTYLYSASQGTRKGVAGEHLAHEGLLKRLIIGHYQTVPALAALAIDNKIEAYNYSQGTMCHLFRAIAGKKIGVFTDVGLHTFLDPRNGGGRVNKRTTEDLVKVVHVEGQELLFYPTFPISIAFLRGTYADEAGNITTHEEIAPLENLTVAQAVHNCGGIVVVQVRKVVKHGSLDPRMVTIPGIYVDYVVEADAADHEQAFGCEYDPSLSGAARVPAGVGGEMIPLDAKKIIGRRGALALKDDVVVNLGVGAPEYVATVAGEEGISDRFTLTVENGALGGVPQGGSQFGATRNPEAFVAQDYQFDFYDGGGLDMAFLGLAQCSESGDINVSRFGPRIAGCGGFVHISQKTPNVYFCGTFTNGGLRVAVENGKVKILQEGKSKKFIKAVDQVTFNGAYAAQMGKNVWYITERCVFKLTAEGLKLMEVAPGIDVEKDILAQMDFKPIIEDYTTMDARIFNEGVMGLKK